MIISSSNNPDYDEDPQDRLASDRISTAYRTGIISSRVLDVPEELENSVFSDPDKYLEELVIFITGDTDDPYLKVKRIHDWITLRIAYYNYYADGEKRRGIVDIIKLKANNYVKDCYSYFKIDDRSFCLFSVPDQNIYTAGIFAKFVSKEKSWTEVYKFKLKGKGTSATDKNDNGKRVRFFEDADYKGNYLEVSEGYLPDLRIIKKSNGGTWNDCISSIEIVKGNPEVYINQHIAGSGKNVKIYENKIYNTIMDDSVSSILVGNDIKKKAVIFHQ